MMIIVEGVDRVGKTTLVNLLSEQLALPVFKQGLITTNSVSIQDANFCAIQSIIDADKQECCRNFILDRFYLSECVYGKIERGYDADFNFFDEQLANQNVILILVRPTDIINSSKEHGKSLVEHSILFDELFYKSKIKNKIVCYYDTLYEVCSFVEDSIGQKRE